MTSPSLTVRTLLSNAAFLLALALLLAGGWSFHEGITLSKAHDPGSLRWIEGWLATWGGAILATLVATMLRPPRTEPLPLAGDEAGDEG